MWPSGGSFTVISSGDGPGKNFTRQLHTPARHSSKLPRPAFFARSGCLVPSARQLLREPTERRSNVEFRRISVQANRF